MRLELTYKIEAEVADEDEANALEDALTATVKKHDLQGTVEETDAVEIEDEPKQGEGLD